MDYNEKRAIVIHSIIEAQRLSTGSLKPRLFVKTNPLRLVAVQDIVRILVQFRDAGKLKILDKYLGPTHNIKGFWDLLPEPDHYIELSDIDIKYFEKEYQQVRKYYSEDSSIKGKQQFFIELTADRRILLNGKIEIAQPDFNSENEQVFSYLYEYCNQEIRISDLKKKFGMKKTIDKVLANLGFTKGLRSTFFDINKTTIKFKSPVSL